jgi:methionine-rich copper-binding protein CopC
MRVVRPLLIAAGLAGLVAAACAPSLAAPPHLVAAWPAAGATLPVAPATLELTFNRALHAELTWATVGRDRDGLPTYVESAVEAANPRRLRVVVKAPLAGEYRLHWHAVSARTAAALDGEQVFAMLDEAAVPPQVEVSPSTAETGDKLKVVGSRFGQRCSVRLAIGDDEQALTTVETDATGSFVAEAPVPQVAFGQQPVSATDYCGAAATTGVQVRWGAWPPLVASDVGQPGPGAGEVTFSVNLRNRSDYLLERVRVVLDDPPGASLVAADAGTTRQDRSVFWEIAMVDRGRVGPFRVTYRVTDPVVSHARIEFRHRRPYGCGDDCPPAFVTETTSESTLVFPAD